MFSGIVNKECPKFLAVSRKYCISKFRSFICLFDFWKLFHERGKAIVWLRQVPFWRARIWACFLLVGQLSVVIRVFYSVCFFWLSYMVIVDLSKSQLYSATTVRNLFLWNAYLQVIINRFWFALPLNQSVAWYWFTLCSAKFEVYVLYWMKKLMNFFDISFRFWFVLVFLVLITDRLTFNSSVQFAF